MNEWKIRWSREIKVTKKKQIIILYVYWIPFDQNAQIPDERDKNMLFSPNKIQIRDHIYYEFVLHFCSMD